jgi:cell division protein ZapA
MSKVSIKVGPKRYSVVTADGDEARITALGEIVDAKYALLGHTRAVQETDNLVFAALFLADELDETRKTAEQARAGVEAARNEADQARAEAASINAQCDARIEAALAKAEAAKAELAAELETLRKAEQRAREENERLKAELGDLRDAARHQHDLFGTEAASDDLADRIDALAARAEAAAAAIERGNLEATA